MALGASFSRFTKYLTNITRGTFTLYFTSSHRLAETTTSTRSSSCFDMKGQGSDTVSICPAVFSKHREQTNLQQIKHLQVLFSNPFTRTLIHAINYHANFLSKSQLLCTTKVGFIQLNVFNVPTTTHGLDPALHFQWV